MNLEPIKLNYSVGEIVWDKSLARRDKVIEIRIVLSDKGSVVRYILENHVSILCELDIEKERMVTISERELREAWKSEADLIGDKPGCLGRIISRLFDGK